MEESTQTDCVIELNNAIDIEKKIKFGHTSDNKVILEDCYIKFATELMTKVITPKGENGELRPQVLRHTIKFIIDEIPCILVFIINEKYWDIDIFDRYLFVNDEDDDDRDDEEGLYTYFNCSSNQSCCCPNKFKNFKFTVDKLAEFLQDIHYVLLEQLVFDKVVGRFVYKSTLDIQIAEKKCFKNHIEIPTLETCSVCLTQETQTKTPCGHTLCFPCWIKIKNKICPICRGSIRHVINTDDDY
jgi:hypothetical protein